MNIDELEAGREFDALFAKQVMGWRQEYVWSIAGEKAHMWNEPEYLLPPGSDDASKVPEYSTDIAATWKMEEMIEQRGLNLRYTQALMAVLLFEGFVPEDDEALWWALIHASPYQRCCAALKAVEKT